LNDGDYVAAIYSSAWYIGQVLQMDKDDQEVEIKFMEKMKNLYRWPDPDDIIRIPQHDIICKVAEPVPTGKSQRMLKLDAGEVEKINQLFES